jgi:hypothetical protein
MHIKEQNDFTSLRADDEVKTKPPVEFQTFDERFIRARDILEVSLDAEQETVILTYSYQPILIWHRHGKQSASISLMRPSPFASLMTRLVVKG